MDKINNISEILWNIVKITFMLLLVIIGVKLILVLLFPMLIFPLSAFLYLQSNGFDWNPISTIIGSIITLIGTVCAMLLIDNQAKKRWLNDAFAKEETNLWIEFRKQFINNLDENIGFLRFLKKIIDNESIHFKEHPLEYYRKKYDEYRCLKNLYGKIKIYVKKNELENFESAENLINKVSYFYSSIISALEMNNFDSRIEQIIVESEDNALNVESGSKFVIKNFKFLKSQVNNIFLARPFFNKLPFQRPNEYNDDDKIKEIETVISKIYVTIVELLNNKILSHKN